MLTPRDHALALVHFIDQSPTAFHATRSVASALDAAGFRALDECDEWLIEPGDRCYITRNGSSIVAFVVGEESPTEGGFRILGAHTDSPGLKLKPSPVLGRNGYLQLGVEPYGGVLLYTWLDRDLTIAGRVFVADESSGELHSYLVDLQVPIARIPSLAIHLDREVNTKGLVLNPQQHLAPLVGIRPSEQPGATTLAQLISGEIKRTLGVDVRPEEVAEFDLQLVDTQKSSLGGEDECFVFAPRLDNLASCHAGLTALIDSLAEHPTTRATRMIAFWDNEECGSRSMQGAAGPFLRQVIERIVEVRAAGEGQALPRAIASSFLVSADMAHAIHPNYSDRHEPSHAPLLGKGPVIKLNSNQSYATDGESAGVFTALCRASGFEPQRFVVRSDLPCGSTIGPISAALLGIKTVDVGNPMLSMHSIRELAGTEDHAKMVAALTHFFGDAQLTSGTRTVRSKGSRQA